MGTQTETFYATSIALTVSLLVVQSIFVDIVRRRGDAKWTLLTRALRPVFATAWNMVLAGSAVVECALLAGAICETEAWTRLVLVMDSILVLAWAALFSLTQFSTSSAYPAAASAATQSDAPMQSASELDLPRESDLASHMEDPNAAQPEPGAASAESVAETRTSASQRADDRAHD